MANKVKFGLSNLHIYPIKEENSTITTYDKGFHVPGSVTFTTTAEGENSIFYADDIAYFSEFVNNGYSGELEMALIPEEFYVKVLGSTVDDNGALIESVNDRPVAFAMGFEFKGDKNNVRRIFFHVSASRPSENHTTIGETKTPETDTLSLRMTPRMDNGFLKAKLNQGQTGYDTWYEKPYEVVGEPTNEVPEEE